MPNFLRLRVTPPSRFDFVVTGADKPDNEEKG
jgi:hypothetical protein